MNSNNQIFTRSRLAEAISRDPSKKADFSRAWETSKNPELSKKTATSIKRSSDQESAKSIELALASNFDDFEDGLQYFVAIEFGCDTIKIIFTKSCF
jgi:hypothetical protein